MRIGSTVLATLLLLGACTSEASSPKQPTDSPTSSRSATPTATAPTMPEQATEDSPEGAAAFVKHWVDVFNYAAQTGDVAELERLSSPDCTGCQSYITLYRDTYAAGGYFKGGEWTLGELTLETDKDETFATSNVTTAATTFREDQEAAVRSGPSETNQITFAVAGAEKQRRLSQLVLGDAK